MARALQAFSSVLEGLASFQTLLQPRRFGAERGFRHNKVQENPLKGCGEAAGFTGFTGFTGFGAETPEVTPILLKPDVCSLVNSNYLCTCEL